MPKTMLARVTNNAILMSHDQRASVLPTFHATTDVARLTIAASGAAHVKSQKGLSTRAMSANTAANSAGLFREALSTRQL